MAPPESAVELSIKALLLIVVARSLVKSAPPEPLSSVEAGRPPRKVKLLIVSVPVPVARKSRMSPALEARRSVRLLPSWSHRW